MLEVKHLTVCSKEGKPLVRDVSFTLIPGEPLGLTGASGSGKTTIIKAIMGILPYGCDVKDTRSRVGQSLEGLPARKRREYCGTVLGFIPQSPMTAFDPHMKIGAQMMQTFRIRLNLSKDKALDAGPGTAAGRQSGRCGTDFERFSQPTLRRNAPAGIHGLSGRTRSTLYPCG